MVLPLLVRPIDKYADRQPTQSFPPWQVAVTKYTFTGCQVLDKPNVLVCGMKSTSVAILWLQNRESCWYNHGKGKVGPVDAFRLTLAGLRDGRYRLQWWETWKGEPVRTEQAEVQDGRVTLTVPRLTTDLAVKIHMSE